MTILLILIIAISLATIIHTIGIAAAGWLVGAPLEEINIFFGPRIKKINLGNAILDIRAIPLGGNVKFSDEFQNFHPIKRIFIACCGSLALVIVAMIAFGVSEGFQKFTNGFYQVLSGAFAPRTQGSQYLLSLYEFVRANSFWASLGLIASKMAAFNLLPLPVLNGGAIVLSLLDWVRPMPLKFKERLQQIGFVILLINMICWLVAFVYSLLRLPANFEFSFTPPSLEWTYPITLLPILVVIAFILVLPLRWYQNYWVVTDSSDRPPIMRSGVNQLIYFAVVFLWTYGSIIGIWYYFGIWAALAAFAIKLIVGRVSWKRYFNRQVEEYADYYYRQMVKAKSGIPEEQMSAVDRLSMARIPKDIHTWDDERIRREAYREAYDTVHHVLSRGK